jgi:uncharacterized Zn-binding protein involved in type VI secretion
VSETAKLAVTIPPEPQEGSVVLDRLNRAWQRIGPLWCTAGTRIPIFGPAVGALRWGQLLLDCGDIELIWSPTPEASAAQAAEDAAEAERFAAAVKDGSTVVHVAPSSPATPLGFLGFTRHGHPVGSTTVPELAIPRPPVARCGGPAMCSECGRDAAVIQNLTGAEDAATQAAAREREERAQAEARPHDQPAQLCANCKQRPPKHPGADDPIGGHYCDPCVDRCHEATEFDHACAICRAPKPPAEPLRAREADRG